MQKTITWIFFLGALTLITVFAVHRDVLASRQNPPDLRNRVVGARLVKDGKSPYFYKWTAGDGLRYYDPNNFDTLKVSNTTSTPFFHHLMAPLAEMPEHRLAAWWLFIEYLLFALITVLAFLLAVSSYQKWTVLSIAGILLLSYAWRMHTETGQNYICIPFFAMVFFYAIQKHSIVWALLAGLLAASLVLVKPTALFFLLPFLLLVKNYRPYWLAAFALPIVLLIAWIMLNPSERFLWQDYRAHLSEQVKLHQGMHPALRKQAADPDYPEWEGYNKAVINEEARLHPIGRHSENGNIFVVINAVLHTKLSLGIINLLSAIVLVSLAGIFYLTVWRRQPATEPAMIAIIGFCFYMASDLGSPVYRHQYNTVQWIFPVMLAAAVTRPSLQWPWLMIWMGLLLNCVNLPIVKMEHTMGEYCLFAGLVALLATAKSRNLV